MSEAEERLQRHVRAMGAMNRQLQAQLDGGAGSSWSSSSGQDGDLLATTGSVTFGTSAARRAAIAMRWLEQLAMGSDGAGPFLVRRRNGRTFVVEGGYRRDVRSGVIAAALEKRLGTARVVKDSKFDRWTDGVPVEVLEGPKGPPFVVVGGRRLPLRGLPLLYPVSGDQMELFPKGPEVNVGAANLRQVMYGRYQRLRAAVARKGVIGTAKEATRRATHRARRLARRGR
jgi:hypothetical protein